MPRNLFWDEIQQLVPSRHFLQLLCSARRPIHQGKWWELIVFGISVSLVNGSADIRKFITSDWIIIFERFLCQKFLLDVFSNSYVRSESQFFEEGHRIRKLSKVAQWKYSGIKVLFVVFLDTKKFITRDWKVIFAPFQCPKFRLDAIFMPSLLPESQF